jgi:hypothetical protein
MSADSAIASLKAIVTNLFPWLAWVSVAKDGGLSLRAAAAKLLHLQGDMGDPAAVRVSDTGGKFVFDQGIPGSVAPALYYQAPGSSTFVPVIMVTPGGTAGGSVPTLPGATVATTVALGPGSEKVTIG